MLAQAAGDAQFNAALITAAASIVVAILVLVGVILRINHPAPPPAAPRNTPTALPPLAAFNGTQVEFLELVVKRHNELDAKYTKLSADFDEEKQQREKFQGAVSRYLQLLSAAWPGPGKMPAPDQGDMDILGDTLPWVRNSRRRMRDGRGTNPQPS